ncbi:restriction endonuclease subunit S [Myxococcus sp. AS-1-15]|uniref:restriction endonuclease subunit S n=1 Tax=Myxococcus sp. AS-1-15 TaxID=2874600 RepID=UPI001CBBDA83|nr:restriction endonuclease subunit S [Myxococcus sp. AS-1-15]MBZ4400964.1 restriction endonuclease subunit S [Myxococcus sp. AS-1-15]
MMGRRLLPPGWTWAQFDEVASIESDLVDPKALPDAPHIAPNHIESKTGRLLPYSTVAADKVTSPKHQFRAGQILYSKIRPYLAKAVLVDFEGLCSADMYPVSTNLDPRFLLRWLLSDEFTARVSLDQGRTVLPKVNQAALGKIHVPVPPLNEQRRIVAKLEALLARSRRAKEALDAIPALLERFRQSILAAAFRGDLTRDWRTDNPNVEPASKLLERLRTERRRRWEATELERMRAKSKVPKDEKWKTEYQEPECNDEAEAFGPVSDHGWVVAPVEGLCDPSRGVPYGIVQTGDETVDGVPTVRCGDLKDFSIDLALLKRVAPSIEQQYARTRLVGGEVLLAIRGTVGGVAVASEEMRGMNISREVAMLPVLPSVDPRFVMYLLASPAATALLAGRTKGVAQQGVNLSDLRSFPVPLPSLAEQAQIVRRVDAAMSRARAIARACAEAVSRMPSLEASVVSKAFRGELAPQDPADEPASALLQQIRAEQKQPADSGPGPSTKRRRMNKVA